MFELTHLSQRIEHWWTGTQMQAAPPVIARNEPASNWIPNTWRQRHSKFLDQQFWCFGQDIVQPPRNALIELGFTQHRSPILRKRQESSCYTVTSRMGISIALWGFGMFYSDRHLGGSILLVRDNIRPLVVEQMQTPLGAWAPYEVPTHEPRESEVPLARQLLSDLMQWLSQYEAWVSQHRPADHRERSLGGWKRVVVPASEISAQWLQLSGEVQTWKPLVRETA